MSWPQAIVWVAAIAGFVLLLLFAKPVNAQGTDVGATPCPQTFDAFQFWNAAAAVVLIPLALVLGIVLIVRWHRHKPKEP